MLMNGAPEGALLILLGGLLLALPAARAGETLYNGIVLPEPWPPKYDRDPREPMPVPYLEKPPAVIPLDVGRQLLVDDFLVQETSLQRTFHRPEYCQENPILKPDQPWEDKSRGPFAAPYSEGVWFDPADRLFKIWYCGGYLSATCYATSQDGIHWEKPKLDVEPGTNVVLRPTGRDSTAVWLDHATGDPQQRFRYFATERGEGKGWDLVTRTSADGIHWSRPLARQAIPGDRTTAFYNPFRRVWVISERTSWARRGRAYTEDPDPTAAVSKVARARVNWVAGERPDPPNPNPQWSGIAPQLYNLDAIAYESLMLGFFVIWQGPDNGDCGRLKRQKRNEILLGFTRDGFHWHRPDRRRFLEVNETEGAWNSGNVQTVGGGCLIVGDRLFIYFTGRAKPTREWDADASTGLAFLRRDGFASMDANPSGGSLATRLVAFKGRHLFVNVECPKGELKAEVIDLHGKPVAPFTAENCNALSCDKTLVAVTWKGAEDLSALSGKPVRFRFHLKSGRLYAFWVSPDRSGASHGYVGAGGPGFTGPVDTVGDAALR
jgi:hypothetical protein